MRNTIKDLRPGDIVLIGELPKGKKEVVYVYDRTYTVTTVTEIESGQLFLKVGCTEESFGISGDTMTYSRNMSLLWANPENFLKKFFQFVKSMTGQFREEELLEYMCRLKKIEDEYENYCAAQT